MIVILARVSRSTSSLIEIVLPTRGTSPQEIATEVKSRMVSRAKRASFFKVLTTSKME